MRVSDLIKRLSGVTEAATGWMTRCPAHDDHRASLSVAAGDNGGIVLHCHAGCSPEAVVRSLNLNMKDLAPEPNGPDCRSASIIVTYPYQDETGQVLFEVVRMKPKRFRQRRPDPTGKGGWSWSVKDVRKVPFRLPELLDAVAAGTRVFICEGEKDCLAMVDAGFVATCNAGGAGKWREEFREFLTGANVVVIGDRDEPGRRHAQDVAAKLHPVAKSVRVIELPDVGDQPVKDAADYLSAGGSSKDLLKIADETSVWSPSFAPSVRAKLPVIQMPGDDRTVSSFARDIAAALKGAEVFNRGGVAMRLNWRRDGLEVLTADCFRTWSEQHVLCLRVRSDGEAIRTMSKEDAGAVLAALQFLDVLPRIERVNSIRLPSMRPDGTIRLLPAGYDPDSRTYTIDTCSYREDMPLQEAQSVITDLFGEFQFHGDGGRSLAVAAAALVGMYCGGLLPAGSLRPLFIALANDAGAGKTTLWRLVLLIVCGSATLTSRPKDEDELRKALLAVVMQAAPYLFLDNLKGHLSSPALEAFVTTDTWRDRVLGGSRMFSGENLATVFITGNGLSISPDIARRSLTVELFQNLERPQDRTFRRTLDNPTILKLRPDVLAACWTLVRTWDQAGRPHGSRSNSSFSRWAEVVGGIIEHAGFGCCVVPHAPEMGGDTDAADVRTLVERLASQPGWLRFSDVINLAVEAGLFGLDEESLADGDAKQGIRRRLGHILKRNTGKLFNLTSGPCRMEARKTGHSTDYRAFPERDKIAHIGHIGPSPVVVEPRTTLECGTDVSDVTDATPPQGNDLPGLGDLGSRRCGLPD